MKLRGFALFLSAALLLLLLSTLYALRTAQYGLERLPVAASDRANPRPDTTLREAGSFPEDDRSTGDAAPVEATGGVFEAAQAGLSVTATVGVKPRECAVTRQVRVFPGTRVYFCYRAVNTGSITLTTHTISHTLSGGSVIWDRKGYTLSPGAAVDTVSAGLDLPAVAADDFRVDVTWSASANGSSPVTATAVANVNAIHAALEITKTIGISPTACAGGSRVAVPAGGDAQYCLIVANTGEITFARHRLVDSALDISGTFAYTLGPSERLTITEAALAERGIDGSLVHRGVTQTITNTAAYTATTVDGYALGNIGNQVVVNTTASDVATATAVLAGAQVVFTKTIGTQESVCADTTSLSVFDPNTSLYYCAILHNTGGITLTRHVLAEPALGLRVAFTRTLAPDEILKITNPVLDDLDQPLQFGPFTLYFGDNLTLDYTMLYTGSVPAEEGRLAYTATASASAFAGLNVTRTPTPTYTPTRTSSDSSPTNTPWPTDTPTWTPPPPTATPTPTDTPPFPTDTPTPTRSYAISLLETPTSMALSPLATPLDTAAAQATLDAQGTLAALQAMATAAALSPLATPTPSETPIPPATTAPTETPTAEAVVVAVTNTPEPPTPLAALAQRPVEYPTPTSTPDILLFAAMAADKVLLAAGWIWFALGSLVFFAVAGLVAGLSFRQAERRRFDLLDTDTDALDAAGLLPPPPPRRPDQGEDHWPDALP